MKKLIIAFSFLNICLLSAFVYEKLKAPKTAYVSISEVFNKFQLKKEYERQLTASKNVRQKIIDSLETELKLLGRKIELDKGKNKDELVSFDIKRESYFQKKKLMEEDNLAQTKKYDEEIIAQINQYVKDFGNERGYSYIYGNDGSGSLMYASEATNITNDVIAFINEKYQGIR